MPGRIVEIQQQILEILNGLTPDEGIEKGPDDKRNQDATSPAAEEYFGMSNFLTNIAGVGMTGVKGR